MFYSKKLSRFLGINHCFFSRKGGFSKGLYKSLNCGRGSGDNKKKVLKNLEFVASKINVENSNKTNEKRIGSIIKNKSKSTKTVSI